jgi:tRNA modification GTPase
VRARNKLGDKDLGRRSNTIFALATARGRAGIAIIRLSGTQVSETIKQLAGGLPTPRRAVLRDLRDSTGLVLDQALVLWFPGPHSFTGEDCGELHIHGGSAVIESLVTVLGQMPGLRPADPGEFSRRAVEAGRMDLTAAEGLADLIAAETEGQRRQALGQMGGGLAHIYEDWRGRLIRLRALVEADIDFTDEDLGLDLAASLRPDVQRLLAEIRTHLDDGRRGQRLRDSVSVAIIGPPNVGKSSLMNALAGRDAAIVSHRAGTTRDIIEVHLNLGGVPVVLADTAGLRDSDDPIEAEGVARARARAAAADLVLAVQIAGEAAAHVLDHTETLKVWSKWDQAPSGWVARDGYAVSVKTGAGLDGLIRVLSARAASLAGLGEAPALTRARHREALEQAAAALIRVDPADAGLAAEDLRFAADAIGRITGRIDIEDVLDIVFAEFCIGK